MNRLPAELEAKILAMDGVKVLSGPPLPKRDDRPIVETVTEKRIGRRGKLSIMIGPGQSASTLRPTTSPPAVGGLTMPSESTNRLNTGQQGPGNSLVGSQVCQLTLIGEPYSKNRPRFFGNRAYTPKKTTQAEESIRTQLLVAGVIPDADHLLEVNLQFRSATGQRRDLDNQIKLVLDACNGFAWRDDFQVIKIIAGVERRSPLPGTDITVTRIQRYTQDCLTCGQILNSYPSGAGCRSRSGYCSRQCFDVWQRRNGKRSPCPRCGAIVYQSPADAICDGRQPWCNDCRGTRKLRKFCKRGHPMSGENLRVVANGQRFCRACDLIRRQSAKEGISLRKNPLPAADIQKICKSNLSYRKLATKYGVSRSVIKAIKLSPHPGLNQMALWQEEDI